MHGRSLAALGVVAAGIGQPLPLPSVPAILNSIVSTPSTGVATVAAPASLRVGAVITAVDKQGHALQDVVASIYPVTFGSGTLHPLETLTSTTGALSVPLAVPVTDPTHPANFFVVVNGHGRNGSAGGWQYFTLTANKPVATVNVVSDPVGPCGYDPVTYVGPPGGAFTIEQKTYSDAPGTIDIGEVHGFGSVSNSAQANVNGLPGKEIGEELTTTWSRTTISQALEQITLPLGQTKWLNLGHVRFGLSQSDVAVAASGGSISQGGGGAHRWIVPAFWAHNAIIFHCHTGQPDEVHHTFVPKTWNVNGADAKPVTDSSMDNFVAMANRDASLGSPLAMNDHKFVVHGQSQSYDGFNEGFGILGFDADVHSESDFGEENKIDMYGSRDCGNADSTTVWCYTWQDPEGSATDCPDEGACGSDIYTAVVPAPPLVPGPAPRPCSDRPPHNPCD